MNIKKSRSCFNLAIEKSGNRYDIVRYKDGFDHKPVKILKNLSASEVSSKFQRAMNLIASTMSQFSVFIRPYDKNQLVELVLMLEDSGIASGDIKIQNNGTVYFLSTGEDDKYVRSNVESLLRENNFDYDSSMITVSRGSALSNKGVENTKEVINVQEDKKLEEPEQPKLEDKSSSLLTQSEQDELDAFNMYPELKLNEELKGRYEYLIKKSCSTVQPSPSMSETTVDPIDTVDVKQNKAELFLTSTTEKFDSGEDLVRAMLSNGISVEDIKSCIVKNKELFNRVLK